MILLLVVAEGIMPAYAVDLNSVLNTSGAPAKPKFQFQESVFIDYHRGGKLKEIFEGKNITVNFGADSSNTSIMELANKINTYLLKDAHSLVKVTNLQVYYAASLQGEQQSATIDYKLVLIPTMADYVMARNPDSQTVIGAAWIGISVRDPIMIQSQYGEIDVNKPSSLLQSVLPDAYLMLNKTSAIDILNIPLIDSISLVQQPVEQWRHLFDPAYIIHETSNWGYNGSKVAITTYEIGESSIGNSYKDIVKSANILLDKTYEIKTIQHASSATIQVDGHASLETVGGNLAFVTTPREVNPTPSSDLSVQVIYAMAGFGGVVAIAILYWSNRKVLQNMNKKPDLGPTGPVKYEERKHWADRFEK